MNLYITLFRLNSCITVWKNPSAELHPSRPKIFLLYLYNAYDVSLCEKKFGRSTACSCRTNVFIEFQSFYKKKKKIRHSSILNNSNKTVLNQWESIGFSKLISTLNKICRNFPSNLYNEYFFTAYKKHLSMVRY